jgi:hypothetical protein
MNGPNSIGTQAVQMVSETQATQELLSQRLQVNILKKALEAQKEQAAEMMRMVEGKGNIIDIRV